MIEIRADKIRTRNDRRLAIHGVPGSICHDRFDFAFHALGVDLFHLAVREVSPSEFGGLPMLAVRDVGLRGWNLLLKRAIDVVLACVLLVLFSPLLMAVALAIKLTSSGPILFIQDRVGIDGRAFPCV